MPVMPGLHRPEQISQDPGDQPDILPGDANARTTTPFSSMSIEGTPSSLRLDQKWYYLHQSSESASAARQMEENRSEIG